MYFTKRRDPSTAINMSTVLQYHHERLFVLFKKNIEKFKSTPLLVHKNLEQPGLYVTRTGIDREIIFNCNEFYKTDFSNKQPLTIRDGDVLTKFFRECNFLKYGEPALPAEQTFLSEVDVNDISTWPSALKYMIFNSNNEEEIEVLPNEEKSTLEVNFQNKNYLIQEIARADFEQNINESIIYFIKISDKNHPGAKLRYIKISKDSPKEDIRAKELDFLEYLIDSPQIYQIEYPPRKRIFQKNPN